jgi:hypothetical protein
MLTNQEQNLCVHLKRRSQWAYNDQADLLLMVNFKNYISPRFCTLTRRTSNVHVLRSWLLYTFSRGMWSLERLKLVRICTQRILCVPERKPFCVDMVALWVSSCKICGRFRPVLLVAESVSLNISLSLLYWMICRSNIWQGISSVLLSPGKSLWKSVLGAGRIDTLLKPLCNTGRYILSTTLVMNLPNQPSNNCSHTRDHFSSRNWLSHSRQRMDSLFSMWIVPFLIPAQPSIGILICEWLRPQ